MAQVREVVHVFGTHSEGVTEQSVARMGPLSLFIMCGADVCERLSGGCMVPWEASDGKRPSGFRREGSREPHSGDVAEKEEPWPPRGLCHGAHSIVAFSLSSS